MFLSQCRLKKCMKKVLQYQIYNHSNLPILRFKKKAFDSANHINVIALY